MFRAQSLMSDEKEKEKDETLKGKNTFQKTQWFHRNEKPIFV